MEWAVWEHKRVIKGINALPVHIVRKYELWKNLVARHGPGILGALPGFHDEGLKGERAGQRSSRLSVKYRVIYSIDQNEVFIYVIEITPHYY